MELKVLIAQAFLAIIFTIIGCTILFIPKGKLPTQFPFKEELSNSSVKLLGLFCLLGASGIFLGSFSNYWELLIPFMAIVIGFVIIASIVYHGFRREFKGLSIDVVLLSCSAFVICSYVQHYIEISYSLYRYAN